ncbi:LuxR C-terminal-related transcriptional regulator, partial [Klebsiella variicola]|uniref:LuxR C-terminal-related transcriptional regulator n=1 Tax=Klebsiella variicola TaxID=244366 RepID=UPI0027305CD9
LLAGIQAGARGYLLKDVALEELLSAVRAVAEGTARVKPAVTERLMKGLGQMRTEFSSLPQPDPLTGRETEILRLMAGGYSNKEIA